MAKSTKRKLEGISPLTNDDPKQEKKMKKGTENGIFSGINIYIVNAGIGKARANLFKKQILKLGGKVMDSFSKTTISHIIVDEKMTIERICSILRLDRQPEGMKIVKSLWLSKCIKEESNVDSSNYEVKWPAEDISQNNKNQNVDNTDEDKSETAVSHLSHDKTSNIPLDMKSGYSNTDPALGAAVSVHRHGGSDDSDYEASGDESQSPEKVTAFERKRIVPTDKWVCAQSSNTVPINHNKFITDKLQELANTYENANDRWRALGYQKAIMTLRKHPKPVTSWDEAKALPGIGERLADKIWEIVESGELRKLKELTSEEDTIAINLFTNIWGVGASTARLWVQQGLRSLDDVKEKANLTRNQKIGLQYFDDLLDRMLPQEAGEIENVVKETALSIEPGLTVMACGSYRRGKATCGDVDVLITHPDGKSEQKVFSPLLTMLKKSEFLVEDLITHSQDGNQKKYMGICKLPQRDKCGDRLHTSESVVYGRQILTTKVDLRAVRVNFTNHTHFGSLEVVCRSSETQLQHRRLDIIVVPYDEFACALMYFTGSAHFNRSMRNLASRMGMSLNEHALCTGVVRRGGEKINKGVPVPTPTEESVFQHFGLKYRPPTERDH